MARFYGKLGYELPGSRVGGVWTAPIIERDHYGEVLEATVSATPSDQVNDSEIAQTRLAIIADEFSPENFPLIKYVLWRGTYWAPTTVRFERPRLIIALGGVYDGPRATS